MTPPVQPSRPVYVNNAGTTWPKPASVLEAVSRALSASPLDSAGALAAGARTLTRFLRLPEDGSLLWTPGCTLALATALGSLPWRPGDRLVTSSLEHHAVDGPAQLLARHRGVVHDVVPYAPGAPFDLDALRASLRTGTVRLVAVSTASNVTGEVLPVADIVSAAHDGGALCLLDAAQTAGIVPMDLGALGADVVAIAGHKGPLGPQGIGALWMAGSVEFACPTAACSLHGHGPAADGRPGYCDVGGINVAGVCGLAAGVTWLGDRPETSNRARLLATRFADELRQRRGCTVYGGDGPRTATVSFTMGSTPLARADVAFRAAGIVLRAGAHCAPRAIEAIGAGDGTLRVSFGPFNAEGDVERVLRVVDALR